uniref:Macrocin-O-methyltransferase (TylF) n=1 Tax=Desulfovibrio sp. U5L TaxID=596152 RepID=I2Q7Q5_9BACT
MCGRALVLANFSIEACLVFEKILPKDLDEFSALMFAEALQKEGRARSGLALAPLFKNIVDPAVHRVLGAIFVDLGDIPQAKKHLEKVVDNDGNGYVHDRLIAVYYAENNWTALRQILKQAAQRYSNPYYHVQKVALDILMDQPVNDLESWLQREQGEIVDSARYIKPHIANGCQLTGTTYQTFEIIQSMVPDFGLLLEFGVRNGHSIYRLAEMFPSRQVYGFDSFEGLPEAWNNESAGSYTALGRLPKVPANVEFVVGWFNETLPGFKKAHSEPIAFMNVDCDLYSATKTIFEEMDAQIVPGTIIVFDEYLVNKSWREDEFKAFQEWVSAQNVKYEYLAASLYTKQAAVRILEKG